MMKSSLDLLNFEYERAPSEIPANLQGQFGLSGQILLHLAPENLKGLVQLKKTLVTVIFKQKMVKSLVHFYNEF